MRYTVRQHWLVTIIYTVLVTTIIMAPAMGIWRYYEKGVVTDIRFYILLAVVIVPFILLIITVMPKVIVFDDHVFVRNAFVYKRYLRSDITYLETVKKKTDIGDGTFPSEYVTYYVTEFHNNGKKLFTINNNDKNADRFIFECKQNILKTHLKN